MFSRTHQRTPDVVQVRQKGEGARTNRLPRLVGNEDREVLRRAHSAKRLDVSL